MLGRGRPEGGRQRLRGRAISPYSLRSQMARAEGEGCSRSALGRTTTRPTRILLRSSSYCDGQATRNTGR